MKNILFIITKSENGGAQKWTKEQIEICSNTFKCFLSTDRNGWLSTNVNVEDKLLNKLIYKRFSIRYLILLSKFIKENKIDLIVASSANAGIYARLVKLLNRNIKIIYVSHGWSSIYNGGKLKFLYTFIEKQLSKLSDSILCISNKDYNNAKDILTINENKLKLIPNKIYPMLINKRSENKIIKILTVARLVPPKRIDILIKSIENINVELHIIGDGILKNYLKEISSNKVFFHGEIDGFNQFSDYDIFALISDSEGLPLSALEAMSVGLPLILSNVGGCYELIENNGMLIENNIQDIEKAISYCILNHSELSIKSKYLFDEKFNLNSCKYEYLEYYKEIINDRK
jgi:glycosyltransferase involved in cell wall biosynthesis